MINLGSAILSLFPLLMPLSQPQEIPKIPTIERQELIGKVCPAPEIVKDEVVKERVVYKEKIVYVDRSTKETVKTEVNPTPIKVEEKVPEQWQAFEFTAYSHEPSEAQSHRYNGNIITASGVNVTDSYLYRGMRIIAVNPKTIPYGSIVEVRVNGQQFTAIALDTGGAIMGESHLIDLMVSSKEEALRFGRQKGEVRIIRSGW